MSDEMKLTPRGSEDEKVTLRSWSVSVGASPWTRVNLTETDAWWDNYIWNTTKALGLFGIGVAIYHVIHQLFNPTERT